MREQGILCFVEIKARATGHFGSALSAVTPRKQQRLVRAAKFYLMQTGDTDSYCRFDVLALDRDEDGWRLTLLRGAFEAG